MFADGPPASAVPCFERSSVRDAGRHEAESGDGGGRMQQQRIGRHPTSPAGLWLSVRRRTTSIFGVLALLLGIVPAAATVAIITVPESAAAAATIPATWVG